jgi:clan AA aspartic protease (TIGR02281 family)
MTEAEETRTEVALEDDGGTFVVPVTINDAISLKFTIDSGASYVTIPSDVASTLVRAGTITRADYVGTDTFVLADGSEVPSPEFRIRSLRIGKLVLHDVVASITGSSGSLLLGQTFLSRLKNWSIDNNRHVLLLDTERAGSSSPAMSAIDDESIPESSATDDGGSGEALLEARAEDKVRRYLAAWSNPSDPDGQAVGQYYGGSVNFYGKQMTRRELMSEKLRFARRWPSRSYTIRANSLQARCSEETGACKVVALIDWRARSDVSSRYSSGTATFSVIIDRGLIVAEHGRVLSRE